MQPPPSRSTLLAAGLRRLLRDSRAATAVEYGLIVSVIVIVMLASFSGVANVTREMWNNVSEKVTKPR